MKTGRQINGNKLQTILNRILTNYSLEIDHNENKDKLMKFMTILIQKLEQLK